MHTYIYLRVIHVVVWQKSTHCKAIIFQFKKRKKKELKNLKKQTNKPKTLRKRTLSATMPGTIPISWMRSESIMVKSASLADFPFSREGEHHCPYPTS